MRIARLPPLRPSVYCQRIALNLWFLVSIYLRNALLARYIHYCRVSVRLSVCHKLVLQ